MVNFRLSQGEKLSNQLNQLHKDHSDEINMLQEAIAESKRKQDNQIESVSLFHGLFVYLLPFVQLSYVKLAMYSIEGKILTSFSELHKTKIGSFRGSF